MNKGTPGRGIVGRNLWILMTLMVFYALLFFLGHILTSGGAHVVVEGFGSSVIVVAIFSAVLVMFYGHYMKNKYYYLLSLALVFGALIEWQEKILLIEGRVDATFLGFYLIIIIVFTFLMTSAFSYTKIMNVSIQALMAGATILIIFFVLTRYVWMEEPLYIEDPNLWVFELIMLSMIPLFGAWYFNAFFTKKNAMSQSIYMSGIHYFVSILGFSIYQGTGDTRFQFMGVLLYFITYGGFMIFVSLAFYAIIKEKDAMLDKTEALKQNLFMFFKSAEYNENMTVFVNAKHEILYANSKYKIFFNQYNKQLDPRMSKYLTDKYEVIKYNMNYSSSLKVELEGSVFILDVDVVFIEQDNEEIFCITAKDITVIRAMQESLERSEYKYRSFFNLIPDFIFLYDIGKGKVIEANDMVYNDFKNIPNNPFLKDPMEQRFMGMTYKELKDIGEKIEYGEILKLDTLKVKDQKGHDVYVEPNFRLISVEKDKRQMLVFLRNVTNSVKLHELRIENEGNLRKLYIAAENEKMFNEFFANMSHELRTPINVILSALDMMEISNYEVEKSEKYAGLIRHNSYRLLRIVSNILDITKVDSGFYKLYMNNYDIVSFTEDTVMSILHHAEKKGLKIIFDTEVEEHLVAFDLQSMERVLLNLLSNAIKFTKAGGSIFVNLVLDEEKKKVYIDVRDTGIGISEENINSVFDRFIQVNKSTIRDSEGTGIGLSIVKKLMNLMGGDCFVESTLHVGTTFRVVLKDEVLLDAPEIDSEKDFYAKTANRVDIEFSDIQNPDR
ncbi:MAG TPA: hypothetical protein DEA52_01610 [Clostridiaceae bacterium]|nr:hypothetical protein [Clostridiaceae bacterium]